MRLFTLLQKIITKINTVSAESVKIKKLWSNTNPTSSFNAQSIDIDAEGYDWICVTAYNLGNLVVANLPMTSNGALRDFTHDTGTQTEGVYVWSRHFRVTTTKVTFEKAWLRITSSSTYSNSGLQDILIPQEIYGIKFSGGGLSNLKGLFNLNKRVRWSLA